jgi:hypothetical protein
VRPDEYYHDGHHAMLIIYPDDRHAVAARDYDRYKFHIATPAPSDPNPYTRVRPKVVVPARVSGEAIADFLDSLVVLRLIARICDGHSVVHVVHAPTDRLCREGRMTPDAREALDELQRLALLLPEAYAAPQGWTHAGGGGI